MRCRHTLLLMLSLAWLQGAATPLPSVTTRHTDTTLDFLVPPKHIESVCGDAMFGIEIRPYGGLGDAWVCVAPDPYSARMQVLDWGYFGGFLDRIVREPTPTDRNFILANNDHFIALDPVTLQQTVIGTLDPPATSVNSGSVFTLMPENTAEILLNTANGWEVRTFPGGALLLSHAFATRNVGHFLSAQSTQLANFGYDHIDLYDAHNAQFMQSVPIPQVQRLVGIHDWTGSGLDSVYLDGIGKLWSVNLATQSAVGVGGPANLFLAGTTPVEWAAGSTALAGIWYNALRVFDPLTGSILLEESLPEVSLSPMLSFWPTDYDADGKQDLLWATSGGNLYYLPNGGSARHLQMASTGFRIAGTTGPALDLLVTADAYASGDSNDTSSHLEIVLRQRKNLQELWRRIDEAPGDSQAFVGAFGPGTDPVVITANGTRIAANDLIDGTQFWKIENGFFSGFNWSAFAVAPSGCSGVACKRLLVAALAADTGVPGSFFTLIDTRDGSTIWTSTPDGCQQCGSRAIAFSDVNGDGIPDIVRVKPYPENAQLSGTVQVLDGSTFQELWSTTVAPSIYDPIAVAVATTGPSNVAVWMHSTLTLLSAADGHVITTVAAPAPVGISTGFAFVAFSASEGVWMFAPGGGDIAWLPADLSRPVQSLAVPSVDAMKGGSGGIVFASGREGIFRLQIPTDHLFADGFQ